MSILTRAKSNEISEYPHFIRRALYLWSFVNTLNPQYWPRTLLFEVGACSLK